MKHVSSFFTCICPCLNARIPFVDVVADVVGEGAAAGLAVDAARNEALAMNRGRAAARERAAAVPSDAKAARLSKKGLQIKKLSLS